MPTKNLQKVRTPYDILLSQVRSALLEGQRRIEEEKVRTYWKTGEHICKHILKHSKPQYGGEIVKQLAQDLSLEVSLLQRCVQFVKAYPKLPNSAARRKFTWTHYKKLITIPDEKSRLRFEKAAESNAWSAEQLALRIASEKSKSEDRILKVSKENSPDAPLVALRGELYHYKIIRRPDVNVTEEDSGLRLDLGFRNLQKLSAKTAAQFELGDIVTSYPKDGGYRFTKVSGVGDSILFTYEAIVENVIDGDTLKVRFDQGFNFERIETLRLRDIDCPELDTPEGVAARNFVLSYIKQSDRIIVRSSRREKYDRYLADVFIPTLEPAKDIFLNNLLLETGHAVRM